MALLAFTLKASGVDCPDPGPLPGGGRPVSADSPRILSPYSVRQTVKNPFDAPLGQGFLEVIEGKEKHYYDWPFGLVLPLWGAPEPDKKLRWLVEGQVHHNSSSRELTGAGMVETEYEHTNFIVWEKRPSWFKIKLTNDLSAWVYQCHLGTEALSLEYLSWETFLGRHGDWLHFRRPVPHVLRQSPGEQSQQVALIGLDHKLELIDIEGDWMKVNVEQPDLTCAGPQTDHIGVRRHQGWVKWRDARGPWVYIYTRGC